jgi:hypothetical protein
MLNESEVFYAHLQCCQVCRLREVCMFASSRPCAEQIHMDCDYPRALLITGRNQLLDTLSRIEFSYLHNVASYLLLAQQR